MQALEEIRPEYGVQTGRMMVVSELIPFGNRLIKIRQDLNRILDQIKSNNLPLASVLIYGSAGTGLSTLATSACLGSQIPFIKVILPDDLIGKTESFKVNYFARCFEDAFSLIILIFNG